MASRLTQSSKLSVESAVSDSIWRDSSLLVVEYRVVTVQLVGMVVIPISVMSVNVRRQTPAEVYWSCSWQRCEVSSERCYGVDGRAGAAGDRQRCCCQEELPTVTRGGGLA
jgi:hypothetical protein